VTRLDLIRFLPGLALLTLYGRIALSLLPAGLPGRHGWSEIPATLAASFLLGAFGWSIELLLFELLEFTPTLLNTALPWAVLAAARLSTLPGAMVPRHERLLTRATWLERGLGLALFGSLVWVAWQTVAFDQRPYTPTGLAYAEARVDVACWLTWTALDGPRTTGVGMEGAAFFGPVALTAAIVLLSHALTRLGVARALARAVLLVAMLSIGLLSPLLEVRSALLLTAFAAMASGFGMIWLRTADRRARALAVSGCGALALVGPSAVPIAVAASVALVKATPSRVQRATAALAAALMLPGVLQAIAYELRFAVAQRPPLAWVSVALLGVAAAVLGVRAARSGAATNERSFVALFVLLASLGTLFYACSTSTPMLDWSESSVVVWMLMGPVALLVANALSPAERGLTRAT